MKLTDLSVPTDGNPATSTGHQTCTLDAFRRVALASARHGAPLHFRAHTDITLAVDSVKTTGASARPFPRAAGAFAPDDRARDGAFGDDEMTCLIPARVGADGAPACVTSRAN